MKGITDDLFAPEVIADPYGYFGALRDVEPVHWNECFGLWLVTGYDALVWILRHHELFSHFELATDRVEYQPSLQFRSVKSLPVRWRT